MFDDSFFGALAKLFDEGTLPVDISEQGGELLGRAKPTQIVVKNGD
ncbi:MAG: hypothetical protein HOH95_01850 [Dehalococcoidia bacterium]|nr:hypothetical protein [Dehalococcoidia bacterium]